MPEKTLKDKVERASLDISGIETNYPHIDLFNIQEALTALEESNECLWVFIRRIADRFDEYDLWRDNKDLLETYEELRKEAPTDGK